MNPQDDISPLVLELRKRNGLTQERFAAKIGVTFSTINRWERGRTRPSPLALKKLQELVRDMDDGGAELLKRYFPEEIHEGAGTSH